MNRRIRNLLGLSIAGATCLGLVAPPPAIAASPSYSIFCRGGSGMTEFHVGNSGVLMEKQFLHANAPYHPTALPASTCAWPDRALRPSEPRVLFYARPFSKRDRLTVRSDMQLQLWRAARDRIVEQDLPDDLRAVNKLSDPNYIVEFRVRADTLQKEDRAGKRRAHKVFKVDSVGVVRQIGQSNQG